MNTNKLLSIVLGALVVILIVVIGIKGWQQKLASERDTNTEPIPVTNLADSPQDSTYIIENIAEHLQNGTSEVPIEWSGGKRITKIFDATTKGDVNGDGTNDTVVVLSQTSGGSGTFYYVAIALNFGNGYQGTNAIFLGDRIAPQTTEVRDKIVIANYADRKKDEPLTATPSVGTSKHMQLEDKKLVELIVANEKIHIDSPTAGQTVTSPLTITGQARGTWYFEASFPVQLLDQDGNTLAQAPAQAQGEWMTEDFVPYSVTLTFTATPGQTGTLVLHKDNPSGLPENEDSISIPVVF